MHVQSADELSEAISQALLNAVDRDALSGWGGIVHIMFVGASILNEPQITLHSEKDKITTKTLKGRMD